jgi:hypothetical protein
MLSKLTLLQLEFWIDLQSFKLKIKTKRELWKCSLDEQEWHLTLVMPSSEWLTPKGGGERERAPAKQQCKVYGVSSISKHKPINILSKT